MVWHRSGTTCHLQMLTSPITASEPSPFPISSSEPEELVPFAGAGEGPAGVGEQGQSRAVPQPTPGTAGGAGRRVTHLTDLVTQQKSTFS